MRYELLMDQESLKKKDYPIPYSFTLEQGKKVLIYFGMSHSFDPHDHQFLLLERTWKKFLVKTTGKKRIVFVEGGLRPILSSRDEAIKECGEMCYITYLAKQAGIKTFSPEPSEKEWFDCLTEHFPKEIVAYYDFARVCYQWHKMNKKPLFEKYVENFLKSNSKKSGWDFDFSLENVKKIHKKLFKSTLEENNNIEFFHTILDPWRKNMSIVNEVSNFDDSPQGPRDKHILKKIEEYWLKGSSIFIVYGASHAVVQEPALRDMLKRGPNKD